jgi:hypothetical protein
MSKADELDPIVGMAVIPDKGGTDEQFKALVELRDLARRAPKDLGSLALESGWADAFRQAQEDGASLKMRDFFGRGRR